jgi:hypothetical protein
MIIVFYINILSCLDSNTYDESSIPKGKLGLYIRYYWNHP